MRPAVQGMFRDAVRRYQAGQLAESGQLFQVILKTEPRHADSLHLLGLIACHGGRYDTAIELIGQAIRFRRDNPCYHSNLGNVLKLQGRIDDAAERYRHALALRPNYAEAHNNLAVVLKEQGKDEDAVAHYERALALKPDYADAHCNLGIALAAQGRIDNAVAHYERALALKPDYAAAHSNLGDALATRGKINDAVSHYQRALAIDPNLAEAHNNLASIFYSQGKAGEAIPHYERVIALKPDSADAHCNLGIALAAQGCFEGAIARYRHVLVLNPNHANAYNNLGVALQSQGKMDDALAHYMRALAINPDHAEVHNNLANLCYDRGRVNDAIAFYRRALAINGDYADAHNNLGNLLKDQGKFDDAMAHYARAIAIRPDYGEVHLNRSEIKTFHRDDADLAALESLGASADLPPGKKLYVNFALAKALGDTGDYNRAFEHLRAGNALKRRQIHFDEASVTQIFRRISTVFNSRLFDRFQGEGDPSAVPVFVLGMPRSGSSLIEQILASHPQVHGAGELTALGKAAGSVFKAGDPRIQYPECVPDLDGAALRQVAGSYLGSLPALADGKTRITDKAPGNFFHIGLIRLILPNAKIIHTSRDPVDTCLSCYFKLFTSGQHFTYDLGELGRYYRHYSELMAHWRSVLPQDAMLHVSYEDVVDDLEGQARRLIDYCGLPWDDRCIDFHRTSRPVKTASSVQVRQPLFRSSLQRWRRYEANLAPLLHELQGVMSAAASHRSSFTEIVDRSGYDLRILPGGGRLD